MATMTAIQARNQELTDGYLEATPHSAGSLIVITDRSEVEARARDLQAKLAGLGISDITEEGSLILGGAVEITPGLRKGVTMTGTVSTTVELDLDTLPEMFGYTRSVPVRSTSLVNGALRSLAGSTRASGLLSGGQLAVARTLVMMSAPVLLADEALILADDLQLQDGTDLIITNEIKHLTILARRITVGSDVTISWVSAPAPTRGSADAGSTGTNYQRSTETSVSSSHSPSGGDGGTGDPGDRGYPGDDAPTLEIWGLDVTSLPEIELAGGRGGPGQRGGDGGDGGDGAMGERSHSMAYGCDRPVGYGGDGGDGGDGGKGGAGGTGGRGGDLRLYLTDPSHEAVLEAGLSDNRAGGPGGDGGIGGSPGSLGLGGEPGEPTGTWCHPKSERAGAHGHSGDPGDPGDPGLSGENGVLTAVVITQAEFLAKWTAPQIRTVSPWEASVGDTVTVEGANYTADASVSFDGVAADTSFIADTILQAEVPAVGSGWVDVVVDVPGGQASNPGSLKVIPTMIGVTPNPAAVGTTITILGGGFVPGCHVLFRGAELDPSAVSLDGTSVSVLLPAPVSQGPFQDFGGIEPVSVRNPDGVASPAFDLVLRHVLSTGFDVARHGYSFLNQRPLGAVADLGTFQDTYGAADVTASFLLEPVLTGAWYAYYRSFFNRTQPGYSTGFSSTAADEYWSGNPDLVGDYSVLAQAERLLTVAQGHILSREMLNKLAGQTNAGVDRAETSLAEVEIAFLDMLSMTDDERRRTAPIMQLIPAGSILTPGFVNNLSQSHGLLPIRVEYPAAGDTWERRLIVYDNAGVAGVAGVESQIVFTRTSNGLGFVLVGDTRGRNTANGWTLSQASLQDNLLDDVSMPFDYMFLLSPATVLIQDEEGRRFGFSGKRVFNDLPDVVPAIGAEKLYLLPLDRNLRFTVAGTGEGTYTLGIVAGSLGRSLTLVDVPVTPATRDVVEVADELQEIRLSSGDAEKEFTVHYGVGGVRQARALSVAGVRVGQHNAMTLRSPDNLSSFELASTGPAHRVSVGLAAADKEKVGKQRFDQVPVGEGQVRSFQVADWQALGPDSLKSESR